ncbi:MAG: dipeptide epimerase [Flavobacteriaceae bacterium]|nr:dipeptide epimerase [Flavobacteriaceae bacterium]
MKLVLKKYLLELKETFTISRGSRDFQETLIVGLSKNGETGYGEAIAYPYYGVSCESMITEIAALKKAIEGFNFTSPEAFYKFLLEKKLSTFSRSALDLAAWDLYGKLQGKALYKLWETPLATYPITNYTIGIASVEKMAAKIKATPWPIYKIKLGTSDDVDIIKALRKHTNAIFRVDANGAWTPSETLENALQLKNLGVEFIEQALKADDWEGMKWLKAKCCLPLIADESCLLETDVELCAQYFDGINIKLMKCGGLTPARRMIKKGRDLGLKIMMGCMCESTVGISAIAQLLPQLDYVDMDGALLLKNDIAQGVKILDYGKIVFPKLGGSGVRLF